MEITKAILKQSVDQFNALLEQHLPEINQGFEANDEILEIPVKIRYSFIDGKLKNLVNINFVKDRCKDDSVSWWDPNQKKLFDDE